MATRRDYLLFEMPGHPVNQRDVAEVAALVERVSRVVIQPSRDVPNIPKQVEPAGTRAAPVESGKSR